MMYMKNPQYSRDSIMHSNNKKNIPCLTTDLLIHILGILGLFFYIFLALLDGPQILNDSYGYIDMSVTREPIYPIFLAAIRAICNLLSINSYLYVVVILQGLLASYAVYSLTKYLANEFHFSRISTILIYSLPLLVGFLFRFIADDRFLYSNTILTEGIAISLHLVFTRWCIEYLLHKNSKSFWILCIMCFIGFNLRKQLLIWTILFLLSILWNGFKNRHYIHAIACSIICTLLLFLSSILFDCSYNYFVNGQFIRHVNDNRFIATMIFYTADEKDSTRLENEELRELYEKIYSECNQKGYLLNSMDNNLSWFDRELHLIGHYDAIQLRTLLPMIKDEIENIEYANDYSKDERVDQIVKYYNNTLLIHKIDDIAPVFIDNFFTGLATTASQRNRLLAYWAWIIYIIYAVLLVKLMCYKSKDDICRKVILFAFFVLLNIIINVFVVSAVVFCQTRYTIYNMPLLYMACYLLLCENVRIIRKHDISLSFKMNRR